MTSRLRNNDVILAKIDYSQEMFWNTSELAATLYKCDTNIVNHKAIKSVMTHNI